MQEPGSSSEIWGLYRCLKYTGKATVLPSSNNSKFKAKWKLECSNYNWIITYYPIHNTLTMDTKFKWCLSGLNYFPVCVCVPAQASAWQYSWQVPACLLAHAALVRAGEQRCVSAAHSPGDVGATAPGRHSPGPSLPVQVPPQSVLGPVPPSVHNIWGHSASKRLLELSQKAGFGREQQQQLVNSTKGVEPILSGSGSAAPQGVQPHSRPTPRDEEGFSQPQGGWSSRSLITLEGRLPRAILPSLSPTPPPPTLTPHPGDI